MLNLGYSLRIPLLVSIAGVSCFIHMPVQGAEGRGESQKSKGGGSEAVAEDMEGRRRVGVLEEVIVTANFRSESIQDVAGSISGFDEKQLKNLLTENIGDLAKFTPSLSNRDRGPGNNDMNIRGIGRVTNISDASPTANPIAMYLDDISINTSSSSAADIDFFGIGRVEVLRGAQGTLYGESAEGGAIKFYSRDPMMSEFSGQVEMDASRGYSDSGKYGHASRLLIDAPLVENSLGVVLSGNYQHNKGFIDNTREDGREDDTNEYKSRNARGILLAEITERFTARLAVHYHELELNAAQMVDDLDEGRSKPRVKTSLQTTDDWQKDKINLVPLKLSYEFDNFSIQSITGRYTRDVSYDKFESLTAMFASIVLTPTSGHFADGHLDFVSEFTQLTQELRFISNWDSAFSFVGGAYYRESEYFVKARGYTKDNPGLTVYRGNVDSEGNDISEGSTQESTQISLFGELTWDITDRWSATVGVRRHKEELDSYSDSVSMIVVDDPTILVTTMAGLPVPLGNIVPINTPVAALTSPPLTQELDLKKWLPMARVEYKPNDDSLYYFRYSTGLRNGNTNSAILLYGNALVAGDPSQAGPDNPDNTYGPDFVKAYELGAKWTFFQGAWTLNSSLYDNEWKDLQVFFGKPLGITKNASAARTYGLEVESFLALSENVFLFLGGSMANAELTEDFQTSTSSNSQPVPKGTPIAYVQRYAYSGGLSYRDSWDNGLMFNSSLSYSYTGPYKLSLVQLGDSNNDGGRSKQVNASIEIGTKRWKAALKGSNILNEYSIVAFAPGTKAYETFTQNLLPVPEGESIDSNFINTPRALTFTLSYFF